MAHNNTQQMEFYDNTSVNHSINVKQSNDVHFICDSNDRRKLKIIISGLYMLTIFDGYKSTQNSHIQLNIDKPFHQLHLQHRPFYRHTLTTIKWHHKNEKKEELLTLISKEIFKLLCLPTSALANDEEYLGKFALEGVFAFLYFYT